jgi:hypothetical protein
MPAGGSFRKGIDTNDLIAVIAVVWKVKLLAVLCSRTANGGCSFVATIAFSDYFCSHVLTSLSFVLQVENMNYILMNCITSSDAKKSESCQSCGFTIKDGRVLGVVVR